MSAIQALQLLVGFLVLLCIGGLIADCFRHRHLKNVIRRRK